MADAKRTVVYVGPLRPGVTVGKLGRRGAVDALYGVPVDVPEAQAEQLLQQVGVWAAPEDGAAQDAVAAVEARRTAAAAQALAADLATVQSVAPDPPTLPVGDDDDHGHGHGDDDGERGEDE